MTNKSIDWPNLTDDRVHRLRDYDTSPKVRRQARKELSERSAMAALRDEFVRELMDFGEDPATKIRARHEWARRQASAQPHATQEAEHAAAN